MIKWLAGASLIPVEQSAPVISGTAEVDGTLTCANGAYTNSPVSFKHQWYSNTANSLVGATAITGETNPTLTPSVALQGLYAFCEEEAFCVGGGASGWIASNILGPIAANTGLTTPALTVTSATGAAPEWDTTIGADIFEGFYFHFEVSHDGVKNVDGSYTSAAYVGDYQIQPGDVQAGSISHATLVANSVPHYADPSGTWYIHGRWLREDGVTSNWSADITGTVSASIGQFYSTNGANKSSSLTLSNGNLTATVNANQGAPCAARITPAIPVDEFHFEATIVSMHTAGTPVENVFIGVAGDVASFAGTTTLPGSSTALGATIGVAYQKTFATLYYNGSSHNIMLTGSIAPVAGDKLVMEGRISTNTVHFWFIPAATGIAQDLTPGGVTLTSNIPDVYYGQGGGYTLSGGTGDALTINCGATPFAMTPTAGYSGW